MTCICSDSSPVSSAAARLGKKVRVASRLGGALAVAWGGIGRFSGRPWSSLGAAQVTRYMQCCTASDTQTHRWVWVGMQVMGAYVPLGCALGFSSAGMECLPIIVLGATSWRKAVALEAVGRCDAALFAIHDSF